MSPAVREWLDAFNRMSDDEKQRAKAAFVHHNPELKKSVGRPKAEHRWHIPTPSDN
jgi:hypothetical protein